MQQFVPAAAGRLAWQHASRRRDNGWITVYDDACDRDPSVLRRLANELSERTGAVVIAIGVEHEQVVRFVLLEAGSHRRRVPLRSRALRPAAARAT